MSLTTMEIGLFEGGPPLRLEEWLHLRKPGERWAGRGAITAAVAAWVPLALLAAVSGDFIRAGGVLGSFPLDVAVHARYLVALPALVFAESLCTDRLSEIARHFLDAGLVPDSERPKFDAAVASTRGLRDSRLVEIAVVLFAYLASMALTFSALKQYEPEWHFSSAGARNALSLAGWWHVFVSLPLLFILLFGWLWRVVLWARFLFLMSRLNLRLIASHPDRCGGLQVTGDSLRAFAMPAFAMSVIMAGGVTNRVVHQGASLLDFRYLVVALIGFIIALFSSPLLVFARKLLAYRRRGVLEYGTLADRIGREFERRWLDPARPFAENPLSTEAFSATTDLYQVVERVYQLRLIPVDLMSVLALVGAALLPFVPVLLFSIPLNVLLKKFAGLII